MTIDSNGTFNRTWLVFCLGYRLGAKRIPEYPAGRVLVRRSAVNVEIEVMDLILIPSEFKTPFKT